jgi:hypothetical protein
MSKTTMWSVVGLVSLAGLACGRTSGGLGGIPAEQAPDEIARTVCAKAYDCCMPSQLMGNDLAGTDEPSCEQKTRDAHQQQLAAVLASQDRFRSDYDGAKLEACLAYIRSNTCETLGQTNHFSGIPNCDSFVQGRVQKGAACTYDWECVNGHCAKTEGQIDGVCQPLSAAGESCAEVKCEKALLCDSESKTCTSPLAEGAMCARADQCASGNCATAAAGGSSCGPRKGGACFYASACAYGGPVSPTLSLGALALAGLMLLVRRGGGTGRWPRTPPRGRTR